MRLALSTDAAPDLALPGLVAAAGRRGFAGLELVEGHAHGVDPRHPGVVPREHPIIGFRAATASQAYSEDGARLSGTLGIPVIAPRGPVARETAHHAGELYSAAGGVLLFCHGSDSLELAALRRSIDDAGDGVLGLAWEVEPGSDDLTRAPEILDAAGPALRYIRIRGGGPEAEGQGGLGIGALIGRLTLARYAGPLVLAPSTTRYHRAWRAWLGRSRGWGCGSKSADPSLVQLTT